MYRYDIPSLAVSNRQDIITQFWDNNETQNQDPTASDDCYFEYLEDQCQSARQNDDPENPVCTMQNISNIVRQIKDGVDRATIKSSLPPQIDTPQDELEALFDNAIDLAVRLYLMVHTGQVIRGVTSQTAIVWEEGSLKAAIAEQFSHQVVLTDSVKFEKVFNAKNIERIADVTIQWTPNLVDHLRFSEDGKKSVLNIFHHARFLELHREKYAYMVHLVTTFQDQAV
jgi:hypothetical protein